MTTSAHLLANTLEPQAPSGAAILRSAATFLDAGTQDIAVHDSDGDQVRRGASGIDVLTAAAAALEEAVSGVSQ